MKKLMLIIFLGLNFQIVFSQEAKKSIAVANPFVQGLPVTSEVAAKFIQLELIKLAKFSVYDEFDMKEALKDNKEYSEACYGISCLSNMGKQLKVDYIICGSFVGLGNKIAISLKWVDAPNGQLYKSVVREFDNQEDELQRMVEVLLMEMMEMEVDAELLNRLKFNNELITSNNIGKINNSGPRVGYAYLVGTLNEFALRPRSQGGLDIFPGMSMIGYQIEGQYVGTENFSALIEGVLNFSGLEQGVLIPSLAVLNGFRFGKSGWELAFGPSFALRKMSKGFFDKMNYFGNGEGYYFTNDDWNSYANEHYNNDSLYMNNGIFQTPTPADVSGNSEYTFEDNYDSRGSVKLGTNWIFAFGRTFRAGALNIPINLFYSSSRGGGMVGVSIGFNVTKSKRKINEEDWGL